MTVYRQTMREALKEMLAEELSPEQIAAEEQKAMDQFNSDMAKEFPAAKFTARATTAPMGGGITFQFAVIPTKDAKGVNLLNAPAHSKYMMHLTDNSGKRVPMSKFSIASIMGKTPVKFRKITGKSPTDAVKKMVDWFKKNKSGFEGLVKEEVDLDESDAYDKDRYLIKGNKAILDNPKSGEKDKSNHVWATSEKEALTKKEEVEFDEARPLPRQLKNPKKEVLVVKSGKVIVIDKKDAKEYLNKGWGLAEEVDLDEKIVRDQSYFKSYSDAVTHALEYTKSRGYEVDEDDFQAKVTHGPRKPSEGKTVSQRIDVTKNGKPVRKQLSFQVYNKGGKNPYELNVYVEEVELDEANYEIKNGKVHISKKEFAKVSKDYKGKDTMTVLDPKTKKTVNMPVVLEEVDLDEGAAADARRAMSRDKDLGRGKDSADIDDFATDDDVKGATKNIIMQLRKSISLRGNFPVEFMDKKKIKIPAKIAQAVTKKHNALRRPAEKQKFQSRISKSYKDMLAAVNESLKETVMKEGTWLMPKGVKLKGLKKLLQKPLLLGKNGDNASEAIGNFIGDDRLMDDLYDAGKSEPKGDARPYIKAAMLRLGINVRRLGFKEDTILDRIANKIQERKNG